MKRHLFTFILMAVAPIAMAQTTMKDKMLQQRKQKSEQAVFERFGSDIMLDEEARKTKMERNKARRELLLAIIDTTQIKREFKQKLRQDVLFDPFSNRLKKFIEKNGLKEIVLVD